MMKQTNKAKQKQETDIHHAFNDFFPPDGTDIH